MERYDSYKDSGVEWIGEIPSGWKKSKIKYHFQLLSGYPFNSENITNEERQFPIIRIGNVTSGKVDVFFDGELIDKHPVVENGDYIVSLTGDFSIRKWENHSSLLNQRCGLLKGISKNDLRFLFYFLPFQFRILEKTKYFTTLKNLSNGELLDLELPLPPLSEQSQIVQFLDEKTSLIDSLIEKTKRKIELLKEERTSLINHTVTKGLNPNVEMKNSGVEWIGEIPSHWILGRIKHKSEIISKGTTPSTIGREVLDEGSIFYLKVENIKENTVDVPPICFIDKETDNLLTRSSLKENDILVVITGSTTGKVVILPKKFTPSNTNQGISFIRLKDKSDSNVKYTWFWLSSGLIQDQIKVTYTQSTQPNLSMEDLGNFLIPFPPLSEQEEIVQFLDEKTSTIDKTVDLEGKRIDYLKEYRQSLISEVVTGKIKVVN